MTRRTRRTRLAVAGLAGSLVATGVLLAAPAAHAAPFGGQALVNTDFDVSGAAGCAVGGSNEGTVTPMFLGDGVPVSATKSSTATVTDAGDLADVTHVRARSKVRALAKVTGGSLRTASISGQSSASLDVEQGAATDCVAEIDTGVGAQLTFSLATPGWLRIRTSVAGAGIATVSAEGNGYVGFQFAMQGFDVDDDRRLFLPAGDFVLLAIHHVPLETPSAVGDPLSAAGRMTVDLAFTEAGAASGPATGAGRSYVSPAAALSCAPRSLKSTWKAKAPSVERATFFVNGRLAKTVNNPRKGTSVTVGGLARDKDVTLRVLLKLESGKSVSTQRSYVSCT